MGIALKWTEGANSFIQVWPLARSEFIPLKKALYDIHVHVEAISPY